MRTLLLTAFLALIGSTLPPPLHAQAESYVESEVVTLTNRGFARKPIRRGPGPFVIVLQNHSNVEQVTVALERLRGAEPEAAVDAVVGRRDALKRRLRTSDHHDLQPGTYRLRILERPEWVLRVEIRPEHARSTRARVGL